MKELNFCPKCGKKTLQWDGEKKWNCSDCDYVLFHNVAGAVAVIMIWGNKIMFTRRNQEPKNGFLDLSGGFTDPKESAEETCKRELFEELGISIDENKLQYLGSLPNVYEYKNILYNTIDLFFKYEIENKINISIEESEISEVLWISIDEIDIHQIAFDSQKKFLENYLKQIQ